MYLLPALAAGLVRCIHIDRLDKLSEGIGGQLDVYKRQAILSLTKMRKEVLHDEMPLLRIQREQGH